MQPSIQDIAVHSKSRFCLIEEDSEGGREIGEGDEKIVSSQVRINLTYMRYFGMG